MLAIHENIKSDIDFALILSVFDKVVEHFKLPGSVRVDLSIVDEETIRELNRQQRDVDAVTDVLSFPYLEVKFPFKAEDYPYDVDPESGEILLGDIVLCYQRTLQQSVEYGHSKERESCYLVLHGLLHLLGYDHIDECDKVKMRQQEELILQSLGILRD